LSLNCDFRRSFGPQVCYEECRARSTGAFLYARVDRPDQAPRADPSVVDVHVLDMNHGWPNVGHDALVMAVRTAVCDLADELTQAGLRVRAVSWDVRRGQAIPPHPGELGGLFIGTGGPGHLDPARNDGVSEGTQGIVENLSWERPLFALFDAIRDNRHAALIGVCHTFGIMSRWLGVADPVLRGPGKGGKSAGIVDNLLVERASTHPWFGGLAAESPGGLRIRVLDSRLYDLLPRQGWEGRVTPLSFETRGRHGPPGDAITMWELDRDPESGIPRIYGVNHHPEIVDPARVLMVLWEKRSRGEVSHEWYAERAEAMTVTLRDEDLEQRLDLTSRYTLFGPLRYYMHRLVRLRAASLGVAFPDDSGAWASAAVS
jgi:hypothetical protein